MSSERKCQAECGHAMEEHRFSAGEEYCHTCFMNYTSGAVDWLHGFETLASLRAEVEALAEAHAAFVTKVENVVGRWPGDRDGDGAVITALLSFRTEKCNAEHAHLQAVAQIAALTAERDEARRTAAKAEHEINVANATIHEMELEYTTLRQLVLTDEALLSALFNDPAGLSQLALEYIYARIRAARGIKEKP